MIVYSVFLRASGMGGFCLRPDGRGPGLVVGGVGVDGGEALAGPWAAEA